MRMRRATLVPLAALAIGLAGALPAHAERGPVHRYEARTTAPCTAVCPYWTDSSTGTQWDTACLANPLTVPGSYHDVPLLVPFVDGNVMPTVLFWGLMPALDYDGVVCYADASGRPTGKAAGHSANEIDNCCCPISLLGCSEEVAIPVKPGERYVLRAFSWADPFPCPAYFYFTGPAVS